MKRLEIEGSLSVFVQEGGYAANGVEVSGSDLGRLICEKAGIDRYEVVDWDKCRVVIEIPDEPRKPDKPAGGAGFFRQIQLARGRS